MLHIVDRVGDTLRTTELLQWRPPAMDMAGRVDKGKSNRLDSGKQVPASEQAQRKRTAWIVAPMCTKPIYFCNRLH